MAAFSFLVVIAAHGTSWTSFQDLTAQGLSLRGACSSRKFAFCHLQSELMSPARAATPNAFIRQLPKAELHLHLEGAVEPATLLELRNQHGDAATLAETEALYRYTDFPSFLMAF